MKNVLYERFPDHVNVHGKGYRIETDFREWIRMSELIEDDTVPLQMKVRLMLRWYMKAPDDVEEALLALGDFLSAKNLYDDNSEQSEKKRQADTKPAFSFVEDAGCIYSAFQECYGIDLQDVEYMHWWKFLTLFEGLPETTEIKQRMMYRTTNLNDIRDKDERRRVKEIQQRIRLKKKRTGYVSDYDIGDAFS